MIERYLTAWHWDDPGLEEPAETRERLKAGFPRGATRRMTQLGLLVGQQLLNLNPREDDAVIYLSGYGETRALEGYLESFPTPSPTLFQTSIHPSAVEQALIGRQQPIGEFLPLTGDDHLVAQGLLAALLAPQPRVLVCGGEERGTWLLKQAAASERTFAFALALTDSADGALARVSLAAPATRPPDGNPARYPLVRFFDDLRARQSVVIQAPGGRPLEWSWL